MDSNQYRSFVTSPSLTEYASIQTWDPAQHPPLPKIAQRASKMAHWTKVLAVKLDTPNSIRAHKVEGEEPL